MKRLIGAAVLAAGTLLMTPAKADVTLQLVPIIGDVAGPQSTSTPCIICATQQAHNPAGFGFNNFDSTGNTTSFNLFSSQLFETLANGVQGTGYTASQLALLASVVDLTLNIIIDVNTTSARSEVLESFRVLNLTTGMQLAHYTGPGAIGLGAQNGNGFGDWALTGFSLAGVNPGDRILFNAQWSGQVDGGESFWLQAGSVPVPGPEAGTGLVGLLVSLLGMWWLQRRRREKLA